MSDPTAPLPPSAGGLPPQPPYPGPPPGGYGRRPGGSGGVAAAVLSVLFVIGSIVVAVVANNGSGEQPTSATATGVVVPSVSGPPSGFGAATPGEVSVSSPVTPSTSNSVYSPPAAPTPTHQPLSSGAVNRTMETYLYGLVNHNRHELISATCPRLRAKTTGFALKHRYISGWKGFRYSISPYLDYVQIPIRVVLASPYSGTRTYTFQVQRSSSGNYYVCGFR